MDIEKKKMVTEIDRALATGFQINTQGDEAFLSDKAYSWDDLIQLKEELGNSVVQFVGQVSVIIINPEVQAQLGNKRQHFERVVEVFFNDINCFSNKVKELRSQHEHMSGHINDINQFNQYNRIAITYHSMFTELQMLITPTLSDIMLTGSEIIPTNTQTATNGVSTTEQVH